MPNSTEADLLTIFEDLYRYTIATWAIIVIIAAPGLRPPGGNVSWRNDAKTSLTSARPLRDAPMASLPSASASQGEGGDSLNQRREEFAPLIGALRCAAFGFRIFAFSNSQMGRSHVGTCAEAR